MSTQSRWIDLSVELATGMVHWPEDPEPTFERISDIDHGAEANVTLCRMTAHTGTHMDAPCHFLSGRSGIDSFPVETGIGPARLIAIPSTCTMVGRAELEHRGIRQGERILLKTRNSEKRWDKQEFQPDFVAIGASGAQFLAEAGVVLVGVDYLSVGAFKGDGVETHGILLRAGIWIVEGLNLVGLEEGNYDLICLPLRIAGADGSPARVVARRL